MRQIQLAFIDDPRKAALDADRLASELLQASADELAQRRKELAAEPADGAAPDTENLRQTVQRYRAFVDALAQSMHVFSA
jgi:ABC-type transporter Mla subunit MlaD